MILINYFNDEIKQVKELFLKRVKHPYITKFLDEPVLDEDRLFLLYSMLDEKKLAKDNLNEYIITTLLVQAALDTHETVTVSRLSSEKVKKERQLTVLAGDYYSSLYYYLLAKINDITMIRVLANSIQEVNESKMSFYKINHHNVPRLIEDVKTIESSLIQKVADHFKLHSWKKISSEFLFFKRLISERRKLIKGQKVPLLDFIVNENKSSLLGNRGEVRLKHSLDICDQYIFQSKAQLQTLCKEPSQVSSFILARMDQLLLETDLLKEKVAEEG